MRGHKQRLATIATTTESKKETFEQQNNNEKLSAIYNNDSEYINDLILNENDVDWVKSAKERAREKNERKTRGLHMNKIING